MSSESPSETAGAKKRGTIYLLSDGTGETAATMTRAALVQYDQMDINLVRYKNVRTEAQIEGAINEATERKAIIVHTVVSPTMRAKITELASAKGRGNAARD